MKIDRKFTKAGQDVFESIEWTTRSSKISNLDGSVVFEMKDAEVPKTWSQLATDIMVSKYFRKAGVPQPPEGVDPIKAQQEGNLQRDEDGKVVTGPERSVRQVIHRLVGCWRQWGEAEGYFDSKADAQAFYDELCYMMLTQRCAPNSPQWFNTGLHFAYGINGPAQGHFYTDPKSGETKASEDAYSHPQPHACFIQSIEDDLVNPGGIMDLWVREARLFKYGSGTGTNFSKLRAENESLSGGGRSSGLMSFLKIGDRAAGAIKSGGTTRRAAKMVCLDLDHPDIEHFINWKVREEIKVAAMVEGLKRIADQKASPRDEQTIGETAERLGLKLNYDFNGEAYYTVSGQNSNNSVRIPNAFFDAVDNDTEWKLINRIDGQVGKSLRARDLWEQIGYAAWRCADPGVQYDGTINEWHTCPKSGRINASNPCSEYMFLDNTACNLASLNLLKFYNPKDKSFDVEGYEHGIRLWTIVLEISVMMAQYPSKEIARLSYEYRTLGLGYANLGAMLMQAGIPYDSERARSIAGCLTAVLTGRSYAASAEMAQQLGPFPGYFKNRDDMLRVIRNHRRAAYGVPRGRSLGHEDNIVGDYEGLTIKPVPIDGDALISDTEPFGKLGNSEDILNRARACWDDALKLGEQHGFRNAQTTVIAPTGTIGLL
ncbi:MAG: adenosylcobalamin-dependent ribonucleoside-diphosphate reductase, partial [Planctomycetes bacterium]|nr:adenosylcobalamin-dependent ribonucleoside-diphosphate reductase [Planctomycetota bacterium]